MMNINRIYLKRTESTKKQKKNNYQNLWGKCTSDMKWISGEDGLSETSSPCWITKWSASGYIGSTGVAALWISERFQSSQLWVLNIRMFRIQPSQGQSECDVIQKRFTSSSKQRKSTQSPCFQHTDDAMLEPAVVSKRWLVQPCLSQCVSWNHSYLAGTTNRKFIVIAISGKYCKRWSFPVRWLPPM